MEQTLRYNGGISKEPWLAVLLSTILAGVGQLYSGRIKRGLILICVQTSLSFCGLWFLFSFTGDIRVGLAFAPFLISIWIWNLFDAYKCAKAENSEDFEILRKQNKDPWLSVFLSTLIPGLGQIYIRKRFWGIVFIIVFVCLCHFEKNSPLFILALIAVFRAFVCYHTYISAPICRETSKKVIIIIAAVILCNGLLGYGLFPFKKYYVEAYQIPKTSESFSEGAKTECSMSPTLLPSDRLFVRKSVSDAANRGDILLFISPADSGSLFLQRVVAFEGEAIEIKNNAIYINSKKIQSPAVQDIKYVSIGEYGIEGKPYVVPKNSVFVLGDNSNKSWDSRFFGAVPKSDVVGKAYKRYWPPKRIGSLY